MTVIRNYLKKCKLVDVPDSAWIILIKLICFYVFIETLPFYRDKQEIWRKYSTFLKTNYFKREYFSYAILLFFPLYCLFTLKGATSLCAFFGVTMLSASTSSSETQQQNLQHIQNREAKQRHRKTGLNRPCERSSCLCIFRLEQSVEIVAYRLSGEYLKLCMFINGFYMIVKGGTSNDVVSVRPSVHP